MSTLKATLNVAHKHPGWMFWLLWFVATFIGALLYFIPVGAVHIALSSLDGLYNAEGPADVRMALLAVLCGAAMGLSIGLVQWLVLRRELEQIGGWVAATVAGYASIGLLPIIAAIWQPGWLVWAYTLIVNGKMQWLARVGPTEPPEWALASWPAGAITLTLFGAVLGIAQWLVLRGRVQKAGWWIAISAAGWALAAILSGVPRVDVAVFASFYVPVIVAGAGLVWLLKRPASAS